MADDTMTAPEPQAPPQTGGGQDSTVLSAADGARLVGIIQKMNANKEPPANIQRVVTLYKQQYGQGQKPAALPGQGDFQYQPQQQRPIPQANDPDAIPSATEAHSTAVFQAGQNMAALSAQHKDAAVNSMAQNALRTAVQKELNQYPKASSTSAKVQLPVGANAPDPSARFPALVDQMMDPETGYAAQLKASEANDPTGQTNRSIVHQMAATNPDIAPQIQKNMYLLDSKDRPQAASTILSNADAIQSGDMGYDVQRGQLVQPEGFIPSMVHAFQKRNQDLDDAGIYLGGNRQQIMDKLESAYAAHDPEQPVPVPKDWWAKIGSTVGDQGPVTAEGVLAGAIGTVGGGALGNPELGPVLAAAVTTPEFMNRSYKNTLESSYFKARHSGMSAEDALDQAQPVATRSAALDGAQAAAMSVMATKLGFHETPAPDVPGVASPAYINAATKLFSKIPVFAKDVATESGAMGTLGGAVQGLKNINEGRPENEGVGDAFSGMAGFTAVMAGLGKGLGGLVNSAKDLDALQRGAAQAPQPVIDHALADLLTSHQLTPDEVVTARTQIKDQKVANAALPDLDDATQAKVQKLIDRRDQQQKLMDDESTLKYKPEFKASIDALNEQIEGLKTAKAPDQLIQKAKDLIGEDKIPGTAGVIAKEVAGDPQQLQDHLREIASQSYDPESKNETRKTYNGLVDIAQQLYPEDAIPEVQHMHSLVLPEEPQESHTPVSDKIQPDKAYRTIDYGDYAEGGVPETPQARASVAKDIEAGDTKIGNTGETFNEFKPRVIEPFKKALDTEDPNTTIVTSSSVLKAFKVWDDMGRPDINNLTPEQTKDFADRYNDETIAPAEMVSFDKTQGSPESGQIHVIRHGETDANEMGTFRTDEDNLTENGIMEARNTAAKLKDQLDGAPLPKIITSDLPRTIHTSNIIHDIVTGKEVDPRAREINDEVHPALAAKALQGSYDRLIEGGQDPKDPEMQRMKESIDNLKNKSDAISEQTATKMDVRQQAQNGEAMGVGDAEHPESTGAGGRPDEQRPGSSGPAADTKNDTSEASKGKAPDEAKDGNAPPGGKDTVKETLEKAPNPVTGIRNAITERLMDEHGLEPWEKQAAREWGPLWNKAVEKMRNGFDIQDLIDKLKADPGLGLTDENAALLTYYQAQKEAELEGHANTIVRARGDLDLKALAEAKIDYASTLDKLDELYNVTKETGREQARGFNARKMLVDRHYSLAQMTIRKRAALDGADLSEAQAAEVKRQYEDIKAKNDAYEKRIADLEEENKQLKAQKTVDDAKKASPKKAKSHDQYTEERKKILDDIRDKLRKSRGEASGTLVPYAKELFDIAPDVAKLVKSLVAEGIDKLPDLVGQVHDALSELVDGITRKDVVDMIAGEYNEKKEPTPDQAKLRDLQMQSKLINKYVGLKLDEEKKATGKEPVQDSQEVKDLQKLISDFQEKNKPEKEVKPRQPMSEEAKLRAYKTGVNKQIAELQRRMRDQDFTAKAAVPRSVLLDKDARYLKAQLERAKDDYEMAVKKDAFKNRPTWQKVLDNVVKLERAEKLSSPVTIGKLAAAAFTRLGMAPVEEAVGAAWTKVLPKALTEKAMGEAGFNGKALATGYREAMISGMKDAYQNLKGQRSDLESVFGKKNELPSSWMEYLGQLHGATKAPVKRFAFERSLQKQFENAIKNKVDVSDPVVATAMLNRAYKASQRAIFMQDNAAADVWNNLVKGADSSKKFPVAGKIAAESMRWLIPFVKIPSNIIGEVGAGVGGVPYAAVRLGMAMRKGMDNVSPEEADMIMRNFKKGSVGIAAMLLGYFQPQAFGGFYQQGERKKGNQPGWMGARIFGVNIPGWAMESPVFQLMQLGATTRKVQDTYVRKQHDTKGFLTGAGTALMGISDEEPLIQQPSQIYSIFTNNKERAYYVGELAKSTIDPAILNNIATWTDPADKRGFYDQLTHSENLRKPTTIGQHIETGIPGLRENVPLKKGKAGRNMPDAPTPPPQPTESE